MSMFQKRPKTMPDEQAPAIPDVSLPDDTKSVPVTRELPLSGEQTGIRSAEFRRGREETWRRLDALLGRIDKQGIASLSAEEVEALPLLYRGCLSSLSVARTIVLDRNLLMYLENLCLRGYLAVYGPRTGILENFYSFLVRGFPRAVRAMGPHLAIMLACLLFGSLAGWLLYQADSSYYSAIIPSSLAGGRTPDSSTEELLEVLYAPFSGFVSTFIVFANALFRHNAMVGIFAFGLGFALGIPSILLITYNGLIIGAFLALHHEHGLTLDLLAWLSIHGVTEILAILICGAAGLVIAEKILFPGALPRLKNLATNGKLAASAAAGSVGLFFIAGILEGGFRQFVNNMPGRFAFAALTAATWLAYFLLAGKGGRHGRH